MKRLWCFLFDHQFRNRYTYPFMKNWQRVTCKRCGKDLVLDHESHRALDWDLELENLGRGK